MHLFSINMCVTRGTHGAEFPCGLAAAFSILYRITNPPRSWLKNAQAPAALVGALHAPMDREPKPQLSHPAGGHCHSPGMGTSSRRKEQAELPAEARRVMLGLSSSLLKGCNTKITPNQVFPSSAQDPASFPTSLSLALSTGPCRPGEAQVPAHAPC